MDQQKKNIKYIFDELVSLIRSTLFFRFSEEAQVLASFEKLKRKGQKMKAARKKRTETNSFQQDLWTKIFSIASLAAVLQCDKGALRYDTPRKRNCLNRHVITGVPSKNNPTKKVISLMICNDEFIDSLPEITDIFVDATFDSVPRLNGVYQLLTVMVKIRDESIIPVIWVLMPNKSTGCYIHVWKYLKSTFPNFNPKKAMMDFELAERNSLKKIFPNVNIFGCYFHYAKCLLKNAVKCGFALKMGNKMKRPYEHYFLRQFMALSLLPQDKIASAYRKLRKSAELTFPGNPGLKKFLRYYERMWMSPNSRYKIHDFCVHGQKRRTNNVVENFHSRLSILFRKKPSPRDFIRGLITLMKENHVELRRSEMGIPRIQCSPKPAQRRREKIVQIALKYSETPNWKTEIFLKLIATTKDYKRKDNSSSNCFGPTIEELLQPHYDSAVDDEWRRRMYQTAESLLLKRTRKNK